MAAKGYTGDTNLDIGVALPLHHAPHEVVFGNEVLSLHKVDPQHSLQAQGQWKFLQCVYQSAVCSWLLFTTSVANSGSGVVCCGRVGGGLVSPPGPEEFWSDVMPP